ncbi:hypothetical protein KSP40_PGU016439 [Platanthera guangdongensis]|uniref:Uncharacterized protein n=1 Tax=Platanthera guangdongensis TaxID=2320717 RepID=A0ABR2LJG6_9ASPA
MTSSSGDHRCRVEPIFIFFLCLCAVSSGVDSVVHHLKWEIKYEYRSPDCFQKLAVTVNGVNPGPTITATQGDTLVIEVTNGLHSENTAIHWHGIRQAGTYIYHAHYGMQRTAGLYGLIRVLVRNGTIEPFSYDKERSMILNDWWHKSTMEQATGLSSLNFGWVGDLREFKRRVRPKSRPGTYDYKNYDIYSVPQNRNGTLSNSIYRLEFNSTVDVILQNANTMNVNNSETHPWTFTGTRLLGVGIRVGKFDPDVDPMSYNLIDPILKNTVAVHPYGWTALRFRADNPGLWAFTATWSPISSLAWGLFLR